ncbi:M20/M25/M40 family metallo-hydrolase [Candidatus Palauibacter sp.]|uniref:M20/M25/M40 family metallo-hydrolase n=1 Tax=Candidatus Palauibacter sp. TaxID=3101350 RepID=UPI003C6FA5DA
MTRKSYGVLGAILVCAGGLQAQQAGGDAADCPAYPARLGAPVETVRYLADDALGGRFSGTAGERCAGEFIAAMYASLGLDPAGEDGYYQEVPLASAAQPHAPPGRGRNVVGLLRGADPALSETVVVIGAHYDHLGLGEFGSTGEAGEIHNGADDNASGVAALLSAARALTGGPQPARSVLFIAFTGEELGLIGSSWYTNHPAFPLERTVAMINLDMVGRLEDGEMIVYGMGTAPEWREIVPAANAGLDIPLAYEESGFGPSDHTSFYANEIPVLHFFTNVHGDYHRHTDDAEKIDAEGLGLVARLTENVARLVATLPERLAVIPGVGERTESPRGSGAWLGTVPDFTPVDSGVLLAGVTEGSPAEGGGLQRDDILVGLGTHEVADLQGFTDALAAYRPGDEVVLRYLRDGEERETTVRLGDRADRP